MPKSKLSICKTGDIGFVLGEDFWGKAIGKITYGKASHVFTVVDGKIYETEGKIFGGIGKSHYDKLDKYDHKKLKVYRFTTITESQRNQMVATVASRIGTPYSGWDCFLNLVFAPFHPKLRGGILENLGNKSFTKCDEETMIVGYLSYNYEFFQRNAEELNPNELLEHVQDSKHFEAVYEN